jgi:hypothetical protein
VGTAQSLIAADVSSCSASVQDFLAKREDFEQTTGFLGMHKKRRDFEESARCAGFLKKAQRS